MPFTTEQKVLFRHCDPAGIVFYPRYFEIINDTIELWFEEALDTHWSALHEDFATPTVQINVEFKAPSRHGDMLDLTLTVEKLGTSSVSIRIDGTCDGQTRFISRSTLVHINAHEMRPAPWGEALRARMQSDL